jgi:hypothetical protein
LIYIDCKGVGLAKVALKADATVFGEAAEFYRDPKYRDVFFDLLPLHVQTLGTIVDVEEIFEVEVK